MGTLKKHCTSPILPHDRLHPTFVGCGTLTRRIARESLAAGCTHLCMFMDEVERNPSCSRAPCACAKLKVDPACHPESGNAPRPNFAVWLDPFSPSPPSASATFLTSLLSFALRVRAQPHPIRRPTRYPESDCNNVGAIYVATPLSCTLWTDPFSLELTRTLITKHLFLSRVGLSLPPFPIHTPAIQHEAEWKKDLPIYFPSLSHFYCPSANVHLRPRGRGRPPRLPSIPPQRPLAADTPG